MLRFTRLFPVALRAFQKKQRVVFACVMTLGLSACQIQSPSDLLFAPTWDTSRANIPNTYGTQYDCRTFQGSGWKGIAGGRSNDFDHGISVSVAGCFQTHEECQAFLALMSGYLYFQQYMRCQPHTA